MKVLSAFAVILTITSGTPITLSKRQRNPLMDPWLPKWKPQPGEEPWRTHITCETTDASPRNEDVTMAINYLRGTEKYSNGADCRVENMRDTQCTTISYVKTAAIGICGETLAPGSHSLLDCVEVAYFMTEIQNLCQNGTAPGDVVGGTFHQDPYNRLFVFNKKHADRTKEGGWS